MKTKCGFEIIKAEQVSPNGWVVLVNRGEGIYGQFVTWHMNRDGDLNWGAYFPSKKEADKNFKVRIKLLRDNSKHQSRPLKPK